MNWFGLLPASIIAFPSSSPRRSWLLVTSYYTGVLAAYKTSLNCCSWFVTIRHKWDILEIQIYTKKKAALGHCCTVLTCQRPHKHVYISCQKRFDTLQQGSGVKHSTEGRLTEGSTKNCDLVSVQLNPSSWATINNVALYQQPLADSRVWGGRWPHDNRCGWGDNQRDCKSCYRWSVISNILRGPCEGDQSVKLCPFYEMPRAAPTVHSGSICVMTAEAKIRRAWVIYESLHSVSVTLCSDFASDLTLKCIRGCIMRWRGFCKGLKDTTGFFNQAFYAKFYVFNCCLRPYLSECIETAKML